jgi:hypothetical protein
MTVWGRRWMKLQIFFTFVACALLVVEFYIGQTPWTFGMEVRQLPMSLSTRR